MGVQTYNLLVLVLLVASQQAICLETPEEIEERVKHLPGNLERLLWINKRCFSGGEGSDLTPDQREQMFFTRFDVDRQITVECEKAMKETNDKDQLAALQQKIDDYWFWNFENNAIRAVEGNPCDIDSDYI